MPNIKPNLAIQIRERTHRHLAPIALNGRVAQLAEHMYGRDAEGKPSNRSGLRAIIEGRRTVTAEVAFKLGSALHATGDVWFSGPLALAAFGYLGAFVCSLADLVRGGEASSAMRAALLAQVALAEESCDSRDRARELLAEVALAEDRARKRIAGSRKVKQSPVDRGFRFAYQIAREESDFDEAMRGVLLQLEDYALHRAGPDVREAAEEARSIRDKFLRALLLAAAPVCDRISHEEAPTSLWVDPSTPRVKRLVKKLPSQTARGKQS